ncbi:hypothetical protein PBI_DEWDROP_62 [Microbacterium phage Dewdrop]|nr:hypothetical protein PBI_LEAF_62 [Microbacterium phage Leaf]QGZ17431.1 hypothetical protein PBI_DEWDROP_62 [Microbacterium phage Dewdrop]
MVVIAPAALVAAPAKAQLPYGAFSVLSFREDAARWFNGVQWETLSCEPAGVIEGFDCDPTEVTGFPRTMDKMETPLGVGTAFSVYGHHLCTPIGNDYDRGQELARQHLALREEAAVETFVQSLIEAQGAVVTGITDPWQVVAVLEQYHAEKAGSQGIIWTSRRMATLLGDNGDLSTSGGRLLSTLRTPIVAATGVDDGFIGITGNVVAYRGAIEDYSDRAYDLLDRGTNNLLSIAERDYLVGFEDCGVAYAEVTLPAATITPPTPTEPPAE